MRRALVLSTESARHPFRARFIHTPPVEEDSVEEEQPVTLPPSRVREDISFFLLSYASGLIIIFTMIA